jgi:putative transposase
MLLWGIHMAVHVFSEIFLHFTWHADGDARVLTGDLETYVHNYIRNRCRQEKGVFFHEVGGTDDHIHLVVRVEPTIHIDTWIGEIKGSSSHETNRHVKRKLFEWQRKYGVVSFGKQNLPWVLRYVRNQREHHAKGSVHTRLETAATSESRLKPAKKIS